MCTLTRTRTHTHTHTHMPSPHTHKHQFERLEPKNGRISELGFAKHVLRYADMNEQRRKKYIKRIKRVYGTDVCADMGRVSPVLVS